MSQLYPLLISIFLLLITVLLFFQKRLLLHPEIKKALLSAFMAVLFFFPMDFCFSVLEIWKFNRSNIVGINLALVPVDHLLINFSSGFFYLFLFLSARNLVKSKKLRGIHYVATSLFVVALTIFLIFHFDQTYTAITLSIFLFLMILQLINGRRYMGWYYLTLFAALIPVGLIQYVITSLPMLTYNESSILGLMTGTIPIENYIYHACLALNIIIIYEWLGRNFFKKSETTL